MTWSTHPLLQRRHRAVIDELGYVADVTLPTALRWKRDNHSPKPGACVTHRHVQLDKLPRWNTSAMIAWAGRIAYRCRHWNPTRWARSASRWWPRPRRTAGAARGKRVTAAAAFSPSELSPTSSSLRPVATRGLRGRHHPCPTEKKSANRKLLKTWRVRNTGDDVGQNQPGQHQHPFGRVRPGGPADSQTRNHGKPLRCLTTPDKPRHLPLPSGACNPPTAARSGGSYSPSCVIILPGQPRDNAEQIADVTIPAGTRLAAGARIHQGMEGSQHRPLALG